MSGFVSRHQLSDMARRAAKLYEENEELKKKVAELTPKPKKSIWSKLFRRGK